MIHLNAITKEFDDLIALDQVNLQIQKGSIFGLVGSNGAGKTTLLKILTGIYKQDAGEIKIDGEDVFENVKLKSRIAFIPDELYYFAGFSIQHMAAFCRSLYPMWNEERFLRLKEAFDLDMKKPINRLSKGMQRQVAFWLSLSTMADIIVLDEPLDGLDPVMRRKVKSMLVQDVAERNATVIISSHNLRDLEDLCDNIGILHKGKIIIEQELDKLKSDTHKVQVAYTGSLPEEILHNPNVLYKEERGSVALFIIRGDENSIRKLFLAHDPVIFDLLPLTLEEIFVYEMGDVGYEIKNIIF